ncbi:hypothetical protein AVEN_254018-1 [Araneus ventricosus]|uniref:Secreted protein n=1 Tax=Araneus ventricosus TaxID=182803 RepID=A0A4Y2E9R8_ARAVE|nr:hypothetical protein AVEN_254018-1 [Araneus ventricosus]
MTSIISAHFSYLLLIIVLIPSKSGWSALKSKLARNQHTSETVWPIRKSEWTPRIRLHLQGKRRGQCVNVLSVQRKRKFRFHFRSEGQVFEERRAARRRGPLPPSVRKFPGNLFIALKFGLTGWKIGCHFVGTQQIVEFHELAVNGIFSVLSFQTFLSHF